MARVFSQKHSSISVGNVGINSVGTKSVYQKWQSGKNRMFRGCLVGRPYPRDTHKNQLSPSCPDSSHSNHVQGTCITSWDVYSWATHENTSVFNALSLHTHTLSLTHTQPLQINPTWNTGYKRLNRITIKFDMELKPTKHIVVNYNFMACILHTRQLTK